MNFVITTCESRFTVDSLCGSLRDVVVKNKWKCAGISALAVAAIWIPRSHWCLGVIKKNINLGFREKFNGEFRVVPTRPRDASHSHPEGARNRTEAEYAIDHFITSLGYIPYSVSTSARDEVGQRLYYTAKDAALDYQNTVVTDAHVLRMIDVDYYADMENWLWKGRPILVYTTVPTSAGGDITEGTFSIIDNKYEFAYNGGATYSHFLWDYSLDHFVIQGKFFSLLVKVDQVKHPRDNQRRIVCLTPTTWFLSIHNRLLKTDKFLRRKKVSFGRVNVVTFSRVSTVGGRDVSELMISVGFRGAPASATLSYKVMTGLLARLSHSPNPHMSDIERYLRKDGCTDSAITAPILFEAFKNGWYDDLDTMKTMDCGTSRSTPHFQAIGPLRTEDGTEIGVEVWKPLLTGAGVFPMQSFNNDHAAIEGRVNNVRNTVNPKPKYYRYYKEFVTAFANGILEPVSIDEVILRQNKPLQRVRCNATKNWIGHSLFSVRAFMKKEAYGKITDPRNISTCTPSHTMELSAYTYAAKEIFKEYPWFTPCLTPPQIVEAVRDLVEPYDEVLSVDYSRLDGTISQFLREVERGVYTRLFKPAYKKMLTDLLIEEVECKATTSTGEGYKPGFSRLSGSPLTTDGNTLIVAFVLYCAARTARLIKEGDLGKIPGLVYGDDKLAVGVSKRLMETTASELGLTIKITVGKRCEPVTYLSRVFVDPWTTNTTFQEPRRALGKMHLSVVRDVDKRIVARNKANGYLVTDRLTPLLSHYCQHIVDNTSEVTDEHLKRDSLKRDTNFWVSEFGNNSWPQDPADIDTMRGLVADCLDLTTDAVLGAIEAVTSGDWVPIRYELEHPPGFQLRGDVAEPLPQVPLAAEEPPRRARQRNRRRSPANSA